MENIINQLSRIEEKAVRIMEAADDQKKDISQKMEQQTREFDNQLVADTKKRLQKMQEKLNLEKDKELEKQKADNLEYQNLLKQKFQQNHTKWATELLHELIGVSYYGK